MCESPEDKRIIEILQEGIQEELLNSPFVDPYPHRGKRVASGRDFGKTTCYKWVNGELVVVSSSEEKKEEL